MSDSPWPPSDFDVCDQAVTLDGPVPVTVRYPGRFVPRRLALKRFRGEPAISAFAWHFTASRRSSQPFATDTGAALQRVFTRLQPGDG